MHGVGIENLRNSKSMESDPIDLQLLYESIADYIVPERPGRSEPRAVKLRPKPYPLLTAPRREMQVTIHRGRCNAKVA